MFTEPNPYDLTGELLEAPVITGSRAGLVFESEASQSEQQDQRTAEVDVSNLMTLYLRDVRRYRPLDATKEAKLIAQMDKGSEAARDKLICHHLGLVIAMARKFTNRGLELLDLIEEGNLGMLVALKKFDPQRGLRFSTYAAWWIRYYMQTALATQVPIVRPPLRAQRRAGREAWEQWCESHGIALPTASGEAPPPPPASTPLVTPLALHDADIEAHFAEADLCHPDVSYAVSQRIDNPRLADLLHELVSQLPQRQRDIVIARFGLDGQDECTLQQLSAERGVSRERMRQVQTTALDTLREGLLRAGVTRESALT
jgi:RNA polymerase sigma factor (sigma-70 family)